MSHDHEVDSDDSVLNAECVINTYLDFSRHHLKKTSIRGLISH